MSNVERHHFNNLDDEARAELLAYLVATQLVAHACLGHWLSASHAIESADIWCGSNGAICGKDEKASLAKQSPDVATWFLQIPQMLDADELRELFTDGWRLDYRNVLVRALFDVCADYLPRTEIK